MDSAALAAFVREELPRLRGANYWAAKHGYTLSIEIMSLITALDAALGLLREAESLLAKVYDGSSGSLEDIKQLLATLRLVVGEKETG